MKILKITLQNINSLKSDQPIVIDFESDYFKDVGLFAITGSTGSGKTTILDAITIALYHKVPRFNKNSKTSSSLFEVVSYGASYALAQVVFENDGQTYEAHWSLRVKNTKGKVLKKPQEEIRIKNLTTQQILASKKKEVAATVEKITRLNYNQFLRSSMLAQGEFSAFLSAPPKDKGTLLEQITGEEIYKRIGEEVGDRIRHENRILFEIKAKINSEDILPEDLRNEYLQNLKSLEVEERKIKGEIKENERVIQFFEQEKNIKQQEGELLVEHQKIIEFGESNKDNFERLKGHDLAVPFHQDILELDRLKIEIASQTKEKERLFGETKKIKIDLEKSQIEKEKSMKKLQEIEGEIELWNPKIDQVILLDQQLTDSKIAKNELEKLISSNELQITENESNALGQLKQKNNLSEQIKRLGKEVEDNKKLLLIEGRLTDWSIRFSELKTLQTNSANWRKELNAFRTEKERFSKSLQRGNKKLEEESKNLQALNITLEELNKNAQKFNLISLNEEKEKVQNQAAILKDGIRLSKDFFRLEDKSVDLKKRQKLLSKSLKENEAKLKLSKAKLDQAETALKDAEKILEQEQTIRGLEEERKKLKEGEPCQLCGSVHHPLVKEYHALETSKSETEVKKRKELVNQLLEEIAAINTKQTELTTELASLDKQMKEVDKEKQNIHQEFQQLALVPKILESKVLEENLKTLDLKLGKLSADLVVAQKRIQDKEKVQKQLADQQQLIDKTQNGIKDLKRKLESIQEKTDDLVKNTTESDLKVREITSEMEVELQGFGLEFPPKEAYDDFIQKKKDEIAAYRKKIEQKVTAENEIKLVDEKLVTLGEQLKKMLESQKELLDKLKKHEEHAKLIFIERTAILPITMRPEAKREALKKALTEVKAALDKTIQNWQKTETKQATTSTELKNCELLISGLNAQFAGLLKNTNKKVETSVFKSLENVKKALLADDEFKRLQVLKKEYDDRQIVLKTKQENIQKQKQELAKQTIGKETLEEITARKDTLELNLKEALEKKGEIREKISKDNDIKSRNKKVYEEINQQEKTLKKWKDLNFVLGNNRDSFSRYVQRLTLNQLIQLANIHLYKLNRRYSLQLPKTYKPGEELNFHLIDHYQTDMARLVDTSSGGERFIISLALALGLSDLSSQSVNIDSLFIDEGFGALDQNTLETVISTLETLQSQGKMIGIISHVENLKERIPSQIRIIKRSNGVSRVEVG